MNETNQPNGNFEQALIARMVEARLKARATGSELPASHPDADLITALVEGRIEDQNSQSMITHLVNCASCLHITAELIRSEPEMDEVSSSVEIEEEPSRLKRFLDRLADEIIPSAGEAAVFAYEEKDQNNDSDEPESRKEK